MYSLTAPQFLNDNQIAIWEAALALAIDELFPGKDWIDLTHKQRHKVETYAFDLIERNEESAKIANQGDVGATESANTLLKCANELDALTQENHRQDLSIDDHPDGTRRRGWGEGAARYFKDSLYDYDPGPDPSPDEDPIGCIPLEEVI